MRRSSSCRLEFSEFDAAAADRQRDIYALQGKKAEAIEEYTRPIGVLTRAREYRRIVEVKLNARGCRSGCRGASPRGEMMHSVLHARLARPLGMLALASAVLLSGCSLWVAARKPKPLELGAMEPVLAVRQAWLTKVGPVDRPALAVHVNGSVVTVASDTGAVAAIDARTGATWRTRWGSR